MPPRRAVIRIAAFFGWLLLVFLAAHEVINGGLQRLRTGGFGVTNRIVAGQINAEIVISGSSRALNHYDPRTIQAATGLRAFNIGLNGSQTDMQVAVLKTYLEHNTEPQLVIHNLDLSSFQTTHEIYDPAQYFPYLSEKPLWTAMRRISADAWKWKWLPLYGYAVQDMRFTWLQGLRTWIGYQPAENRFQGFEPRHTAWTGAFEAYRHAHPNGVTSEIEPQGLRDVEEVAIICKQHRIPLIFVYSPEYHEMQGLERNRAEVFAEFRKIADRFSLPLWDYSDSLICRERHFFYNSQHLNAKGQLFFPPKSLSVCGKKSKLQKS